MRFVLSYTYTLISFSKANILSLRLHASFLIGIDLFNEHVMTKHIMYIERLKLNFLINFIDIKIFIDIIWQRIFFFLVLLLELSKIYRLLLILFLIFTSKPTTIFLCCLTFRSSYHPMWYPFRWIFKSPWYVATIAVIIFFITVIFFFIIEFLSLTLLLE